LAASTICTDRECYRAKKGEKCPNTKAAVLIDGKGAGGIFYLCQTEKCDVHNRVTRYQPTPQEQAQRKKEALAERIEKLTRVRVLEAIRKKLPEFSLGLTWRW
jgi:hypothetical protein